MKRHSGFILAMASTVVLSVLAGCHKKAPVASAPPAPSAAIPAPAKPNAPTIGEFVAEPSRIERGQSASLRWQVTDATEIEINQDLGSVSPSGRRTISPNASTTYILRATGPGGTAQASTTLDVFSPPPPPPVQAVPPHAPTLADRLLKEVQDAYFDYDKYNIRDDAVGVLTRNAEALKSIFNEFRNTTIVIEGHCDERGSAEYNLALGERRASAAKEYFEQLGIPGDRLATISYGKERPQCTEYDEACWQKNRRVHFAPGETQTDAISQAPGPGSTQAQ